MAKPARKQFKEARRKARKQQERHDRKVFCAMLQERGLPCPDVEHRFHETRRWRIDFAWTDEKIALEVEGGVWTGGRHVRGKGYIRDLEKYNEVALHGYVLIRVTPDQLLTGDTLDLIERAMSLQRRKD